MQKKSLRRAIFRLRILQLCFADSPEIGLEGGFATGLVLLCEVSLLVLRHLGEVLTTVSHCLCQLSELSALLQLFLSRRRRTLDRVAHVDAVAVRVGGLCYSVGSDHERVTAVLITFLGAG